MSGLRRQLAWQSDMHGEDLPASPGRMKRVIPDCWKESLPKEQELHCLQQPNQCRTCSNKDLPPGTPSLCLEGAPPSHPRTCHKAFPNPTGDTSFPLTGVAAPQLAPWGWERGMGAGRAPCSSALCCVEKVPGSWGS